MMTYFLSINLGYTDVLIWPKYRSEKFTQIVVPTNVYAEKTDDNLLVFW